MPNDNETAAHDSAILVRRIEELQGYCFGFRQRCSIAAIEMDPSADYAGVEDRLRAIAEMAPLLDMNAPEESGEDKPTDVQCLLLLGRLARNFQQAAGFYAHDEPKIIGPETATLAQGASRTKYLLALPAHSLEAAGRSFALFVDLANGLIADSSIAELTDSQREAYEGLAAQLKQVAERQGTLRQFIAGALSLGIPFQHITSEVLQFGWGSKSHLQFGTSTDRTPFVSVRIAKSKLPSTALLRSCGIPTPMNYAVASEEQAAKAAHDLGFPVVVKPSDLDRGEGATADLRSEEHVRQAYRNAASSSSNVMIEKHVAGSEYRLLVMNDRLFWAFERVPAHVIGDSISTVSELIDKVNLTRVDNPPTLGVSQMIRIDEELEEVLRRRGQTLDTVPDVGEFVRLRTTPLSATGGAMVPVFDQVHPDNAELAVRATRVLRLDIAGVDFMSPDVRISWRENGGQITEVNAGPQVGSVTRSDMYTAIMRELVGGDGRIPVAVVIGSETGPLEEELRAKTRGRPSRIGIASADRITIGPSTVHEGPASPSFVARVLTTDLSVAAIVWFASGQTVATNGLPFDRVDLLVLAGTQAQGVNPMQVLSVIKDNVGEVMLEGGQAQASGLAQTTGVKIAHANTQAQILRKLLSILPRGQT